MHDPHQATNSSSMNSGMSSASRRASAWWIERSIPWSEPAPRLRFEDVVLSAGLDGLDRNPLVVEAGQHGTMTASAANGFGQIKAAPAGSSDSCTEIPYDFHPMYSTTSTKTRVPWAAHTYNIAFADEIGHFDWCSSVNEATFGCVGDEGQPGLDQEPWDGDDVACFAPHASTLVQVGGCEGTNAPGFDGASYQADWPDGNTLLHPSPILFTSPLTGSGYQTPYTSQALEVDTPRIEAPDLGGICNRDNGSGCTLLPPTDEGHPVTFYPFFSITGSRPGQACQWLIGNDVPGLTANDFGGVSQYGTINPQTYLIFGGHGATRLVYDTFRSAVTSNPCTAERPARASERRHGACTAALVDGE